MLEEDFFKKFCTNDHNAAINALIEFKDSIIEFLNMYTCKLNSTKNVLPLTKEDVIQEVVIKLWNKRQYLCKKNTNDDFGNDGFKRFFIVSVRNKVFDILRKEKNKSKPTKFSARQTKEAIWHQTYNEAKEDLLINEAKLSPLEFEVVKIFCLHKVPGCFKLLVVLNILLKQNNWHFEEMQQMGILQKQIPYNEKLNEYSIHDIYKIKKDDLIKLIALEKDTIDVYRNKVRKHKQFIKRKLQRQNLWKYIHLPT